jgi:hypothetical protein
MEFFSLLADVSEETPALVFLLSDLSNRNYVFILTAVLYLLAALQDPLTEGAAITSVD